jgi:ClpP class serine protease
VIVPDQAKSAATLLALGAHHILMGPTSDLGPVDPQLRLGSQARGDRRVAAKDLLAAYQRAMDELAANPNSYPIQANLLADIDSVILQWAVSAMNRTEQLMREALKSNPDRKDEDVDDLVNKLRAPLIEERSTHGAIFGARDAVEAGLTAVREIDPWSRQWQLIWRLWTKYFPMVTMGYHIYEGRRASQVNPPQPPQQQ